MTLLWFSIGFGLGTIAGFSLFIYFAATNPERPPCS